MDTNNRSQNETADKEQPFITDRNKILIQKISITELCTDAVVNAANEGLWAGGGVCGAIFRAAGHEKLQSACNAIGHCDTGSAVITPGFDLKAGYIIHAVGPVWRGGGNNEPQMLYNAYRRSLELAMENGCHSIGFPLISAGIFGYPVDKAWRTAAESCNDFFRNNPGADMKVIFAVLDDGILTLGQQILDETAPNIME
ncbi:MAG: macro domain-containing protein [Oscillospiraceae bacterium]|nr:macro domain-containing protein [Oscillospiraceae bacterium]